MKPTKTNTNRCYILSKEDLTENKKLKKLFAPLHLDEIAPSGSGLPKIEGMHYYMTENVPEGNPVKKKSLELVGSSIEEHEQFYDGDLTASQMNPRNLFPVQDEIDKMPLEEVVAELCSNKKPKQTKEEAAAKRKAPWAGYHEDDNADYGDDDDLSFEEILAVIGCRAPEKKDVPADNKDTALEEVIADMGGVLIKPSPRPTQEEIDANPDAFVSIDRKVLAPYFVEDCPAEYVEMVILTLLAMNRMRELEAEARDKNTK